MVLHTAKAIAAKKDGVIQIEHSTLGGLATFIGIRNYVLDIHDIIHTSPIYNQVTPYTQRFVYMGERKAVNIASVFKEDVLIRVVKGVPEVKQLWNRKDVKGITFTAPMFSIIKFQNRSLIVESGKGVIPYEEFEVKGNYSVGPVQILMFQEVGKEPIPLSLIIAVAIIMALLLVYYLTGYRRKWRYRKTKRRLL
mgnify:CR=1 FL=1